MLCCAVLCCVIRDRVFAVHAAATENGFLAWSIHEGSVTEVEVGNFLDLVGNYLEDGAAGSTHTLHRTVQN